MCCQLVTKQHLRPNGRLRLKVSGTGPHRAESLSGGLLLCMRCPKFADLTRGSHEISTYDGAGDGHRALAALLSRRARPERIIAQGLSAGALHAGFFGGAGR